MQDGSQQDNLQSHKESLWVYKWGSEVEEVIVPFSLLENTAHVWAHLC